MTLNRAELLQESMTLEPALDGLPAKLFVLKNAQGMRVTLMDIGAAWLSCEIPVGSEVRDVILGVNNMPDHRIQEAYMGVTVGRFANRIAAGKFNIGGQKFQTTVNQAGNTHHGGSIGFDQYRWTAEQKSDQLISFTMHSKDGDQGFPGNLQVTVNYRLSESNELTIEYQAETDKDCPVNLTNHAYFNLMGAESELDCLQHQLKIEAEQYLPVNETGVPLGHFNDVKHSSFDFNEMKTVGRDFLNCSEQKKTSGYDHSFLLKKEHQDGESIVAQCISPDQKVTMNVKTTKPAIQLYTGNFLSGTPNRLGGQYKNHSALALETQFLPDSPNHPEWDQPCPILQAGEAYAHRTCYQFIVN
ncbi:galactose-1-epimerase [Psychromonas ossibalaenae]|uniref:galactose-1-epimerase n=1 Tax=Psychromonas ossibalaenae TaxID=444922 RepID=UPI000379F80F|nr:galactose-1-epimerase [Psychromonas ossibalaenae]